MSMPTHDTARLLSRLPRLDQLQALEARMPFLANNDVIMHGYAERARDLADRLRHLDIGPRRCRIAGGVIVQDSQLGTKQLIKRQN